MFGYGRIALGAHALRAESLALHNDTVLDVDDTREAGSSEAVRPVTDLICGIVGLA